MESHGTAARYQTGARRSEGGWRSSMRSSRHARAMYARFSRMNQNHSPVIARCSSTHPTITAPGISHAHAPRRARPCAHQSRAKTPGSTQAS